MANLLLCFCGIHLDLVKFHVLKVMFPSLLICQSNLSNLPVRHERSSHYRVRRCNPREHKEEHEVDMGCKVRHEFYDRHFVKFVTQWEGKKYPYWRADNETKEKKHCSPSRPCQTSSPKFLKQDRRDMVKNIE